MIINPSLTALQNILALVTDPELGQPVNPDNLAAGTPAPFDPTQHGPVYGAGANVDGVNNNTQVIVYERPDLDDVLEDGQSQKISYQRQALQQAIGEQSTHLTLPANATPLKVMQAVATQLGLIASELYFPTPYIGQPSVFAVAAMTNSLVYLPSAITIAATYS